MAAKFSDIEEDAVPESGDSVSLQSDEATHTAKETLKTFGFTHQEMEDIASAYGEDLYQAVETSERFAKLDLGKDNLFKFLMSGKEATQSRVQGMIKKAVSDVPIADSSPHSNHSSYSAPELVTEDGTLTNLRSSSSALDTPITDVSESNVTVDEDDMPVSLKEGQFDIFLLFCEDDNIKALRFKRFLEEKLGMKVCYIGNNFIEKRNQFDQLQDAIENSLYTFIWVTKTMIGDPWLKYKQDTALAHSIETNGEFVVPVRAEEHCTIPFSLLPLTALRVYHIMEVLPDDPMFITQGQSQRTIDENSHEALQLPFVKNQIIRLVRAKERLKKRREQMNEDRRKEWREKEKIRKYKEAKDKEIEDTRRSIQQAQMKKDIDENAKTVIQNMQQQTDMKMNQGNPLLLFAMMRQMGMNEAADELQLKSNLFGAFSPNFPAALNSAFMPSAAQFAALQGGGVHIHIPDNVNPADLAPQVSLAVQVQQPQNVQVGDHNQVVFEAAPSQVPLACPGNLDASPSGRQSPSVTSSNLSHLNSEREISEQTELGLTSEEDSCLSLVEELRFDPIEELRPTLEEDEQTVAKRQHSSDSAFADQSLENQQQRMSNVGSMETSFIRNTNETNSEFPSSGTTHAEEEPPARLSSLSVHHYNSATEHLNHPPSINSESSMQNPISLIEGPAEALDDAMSIRSVPHARGPLQSPELPSGERNFHLTMNKSQARVNIS